jgi:hypothetical protein
MRADGNGKADQTSAARMTKAAQAAATLMLLLALALEGCAGGKGSSRSRIPDCEDVPNGRPGVTCMNRPDL